jgi:hypothetical protein
MNTAIGINVRNDQNVAYADLIVDGHKAFETRASDTLRPYVGKRVCIVRTGAGKARAIGSAVVGEPIVVDEAAFAAMRDQHHVPAGSAFDIKPGATKHLYPMLDPVRFAFDLPVAHGIVSRRVILPTDFRL